VWQASAWSFAASAANRLIAAIVTKIENWLGHEPCEPPPGAAINGPTGARLRHHGTKIEAYNVLPWSSERSAGISLPIPCHCVRQGIWRAKTSLPHRI
jgi:hypothetical protein